MSSRAAGSRQLGGGNEPYVSIHFLGAETYGKK